MISISKQFEHFDEAPGFRVAPHKSRAKAKLLLRAASSNWDAEAAAARLEDSGDYRILRRLVPRPVLAIGESRHSNVAVRVDTETTGLSHDTDEVIEVGAVAFTFSDDG